MLKRIDCFKPLKYMGWSAVLVAATAAAATDDRKRCAAPGHYEPRNGTDLLARAFDGPSFFGEGRWMNYNKYVVEPPCDLKEGDAFACSVVAKIPRNGSRARILMVGDSISIRQFQDLKRRVQRCDADVAFLRADRLRERDLAKGQQEAYPVCKADALLVNTGAHYPDVRPFSQDLTKFLRSLNATCPTTPFTIFRTTPEGNPLCNSKMVVRDWEAQVWSVLNGSRPVPNDALSFSRGWHWDLFQRYNAEAARIIAAYDWITVADVATMARRVPTGGWERRPGKPKDCLHGSPAVPWNNALVLNVLDAVL